MNAPPGLLGRLRLPAMALPLGLYVLLRGLDAPVLKRLQELGLQHQVGGENPIGFYNVFFFAQLVVGVTALLARALLAESLPRLFLPSLLQDHRRPAAAPAGGDGLLQAHGRSGRTVLGVGGPAGLQRRGPHRPP